MTEPPAGSKHRLWGGGFEQAMHPALRELSSSLDDDLPLADADCEASAAWAEGLAKAGVITEAEFTRIHAALLGLRDDLASGRWVPERDAEDIHTAIEAEVIRRAGDAGAKLHTGRSRNDQVATAFRMAVRGEARDLGARTGALAAILVGRAEAEVDTLVPAYTHLQRAQPVRLAHWLLAHVWPLTRDLERLRAALTRIDVLPLGAGAATGSAFAIDRDALRARLGFGAVSANSLDAVGDRDFAAEFAFDCALLMTHLSRLAEELVLWSTAEFGFVRWPDSLATGSSLMPNKKNPDLAELVRARAATAIGDQLALLVLLKGLPASYQRDLQETKPPVWRVARTTRISLAAMTAAMEGIAFDRGRMAGALTDDILATDVADRLVARGIAFRDAHDAVSRAVAAARRRGLPLRAMAAHPGELVPPLTAADLDGRDHEAAVERRTTAGGTARNAVRDQIAKAREILADLGEPPRGAGARLARRIQPGGVSRSSGGLRCRKAR